MNIVGDIRIVKADEMNWAVERYTEVETRKDGKLTGETRREWKEVGYYGSKIEWAFRGAILHATNVGCEPTTKEVEIAYNAAVKALKGATS